MSTFKKMVEQRRARTGETWQTASRLVRAQARREPTSAPAEVRDAMAAYGEAGRQVLRTKPIAAGAIDPTPPEALSSFAKAQQRLHDAVDTEEVDLREQLGLPPKEGLVVQWLYRQKGGIVDASYAVVRYDSRRGKTFEQAVAAARRALGTRGDVLQVTIRRMDRAGHPTVCEWKRKAVADEFVFARHHAADDLGPELPGLFNEEATIMDYVIEILMKACGALGVRPPYPFPTVHEFEAMLLEQFPARGEAEKAEQLSWVLQAVREAEAHRLAGAVECIKRVGALS